MKEGKQYSTLLQLITPIINVTYFNTHALVHLPQEAIAYFPLVLLASGFCGTAIAKFLNNKYGSKVSVALIFQDLFDLHKTTLKLKPEISLQWTPLIFIP